MVVQLLWNQKDSQVCSCGATTDFSTCLPSPLSYEEEVACESEVSTCLVPTECWDSLTLVIPSAFLPLQIIRNMCTFSILAASSVWIQGRANLCLFVLKSGGTAECKASLMKSMRWQLLFVENESELTKRKETHQWLGGGTMLLGLKFKVHQLTGLI